MNDKDNKFIRTRADHKIEAKEDYLKTIKYLINTKNEARLNDLSKELKVTNATASRVLDKLRKNGYIESEPYRSIFLTLKGKKLAELCNKRHEIIVNHLINLGVSKETAILDAEGIEHHISAETLEAFAKNLK